MEHLWSKCQLTVVITITGLLHLAELSDVVTGFQRCYNTTEDTHCFSVQYDATNNKPLTASFDSARERCNGLQSTLVIIQDEATNDVFQQFMNDTYNTIPRQSVWTDAHRFNDYNESYRWQWLDSTLPNISASDVSFPYSPDDHWYVACLEFRNGRFQLTAQQPHFNISYICEYSASSCSALSSNMRQFDGRCYSAINDQINWYEARNRCLKDGGDLASFANVANIGFTSWIELDTSLRYWIGLRFARYTWIDSDEDVRFSKWIVNYNDWVSPCLIACFSCSSSFSWFPKDCSLTQSIYVVCHTVTTLHPTTTSRTTTPTALTTSRTEVITSSGAEIPASNTSLFPHELNDNGPKSETSLAIGIGVGVGVGVPVIIAVIVIAICIVVRKRRREIKSSAQSTNRQRRESTPDKPASATNVTANGELAESAYGTVLPSTLSRLAVESGGDNSAKESTEYAPLQFL